MRFIGPEIQKFVSLTFQNEKIFWKQNWKIDTHNNVPNNMQP